MPFVQRDQNGTVTGVYANRQPGYAEEELAANHSEITVYRAPKIAAVDPVRVFLDELRDSPAKLDRLKALVAR